VVAEGRDVDAGFPGNIEDVLSFFSLDIFAVKFESDHRSYLFYFFGY